MLKVCLMFFELRISASSCPLACVQSRLNLPTVSLDSYTVLARPTPQYGLVRWADEVLCLCLCPHKTPWRWRCPPLLPPKQQPHGYAHYGNSLAREQGTQWTTINVVPRAPVKRAAKTGWGLHRPT
jgi:hypothetical protein